LAAVAAVPAKEPNLVLIAIAIATTIAVLAVLWAALV
jgi:hypothetical protein